MENFENFENLDQGTAPATEAPANDTKAAKKKEKIKKMEALLQDTINKQPDIVEKLNSLSDKIEVINTLCFGDSGNLVVDKAKTAETGERSLVQTSKICGYIVRNNGTEAVSYVTEEYAPNGEGKWVGTKVTKTIEPGATVAISRKYMTVFASMPEISFQLANGKIIRSSASSVKSLDDELEAYYFSFADNTVTVHSDDIKINIGKKVKDSNSGEQVWVVKKEYEPTFGYLNNPEEVKAKGGKGGSKKSGFSAQTVAANYIQRLISESAQM